MDTDKIEVETVEAIESIEQVFSMLPIENRAVSYDKFHSLTLLALRTRGLIKELDGRILVAAQFRRTNRKITKLLDDANERIKVLEKNQKTNPPTNN